MRFFIWWNIKTMNILIVGNGFDLSHYLPTKYDHFMDAMQEIENKKLEKPVTDLLETPLDSIGDLIVKYFQFKTVVNKETYEINFNQLFVNCRDSGFISKTFDFYKVENSKLTFEQIVELQLRLAKNSWYKYFKKHVQDVKTWIDFEKKIESALVLIFKYINEINLKFDKYGKFEKPIKLRTKSNVEKSDGHIYMSHVDIEQLIILNFCLNNTHENNINFGGLGLINHEWFNVEKKSEYGFSTEKYINYLHSELEDFIEIFNLYLKLVVDKLEPKTQFKIESKDWVQPDHIFSFNYTNTFQKFYQNNVKTEYLHGKFGEQQNIVLGISDLEDESLRKLKAYGFTKYHQKLFKDTEYLFLDECSEVKQQIRSLKHSGDDINFRIWGHSLDRSDQEYIKEIFKLNDEEDVGVRVTVYYFNDSAKFVLLNNLLDILKKDKVEKWMKNKWLIFEKNPEIKF